MNFETVENIFTVKNVIAKNFLAAARPHRNMGMRGAKTHNLRADFFRIL